MHEARVFGMIDAGNPLNEDHPLARGLLAWWLTLPQLGMGGDVLRDLSARYHGTFTNIAQPATATSGWNRTTRYGGFGQIFFDGLNDYVALGTTLDVSSVPFTLAGWIYPASNYNSDYRGVLTKGNSWVATDMRFAWTSLTGTGAVRLAQEGSDITFSYNPPLTTWTHIALVAASGGTSLYVNGILQESLGVFTLGTGGATNATIGFTSNGIEDPFSGAIDDVRIYTRALTAPTVLALYLNSLLGYPGLLNFLPVGRQYGVTSAAGGRTTRNTLASPLGMRLGRGLWTHGGSG